MNPGKFLSSQKKLLSEVVALGLVTTALLVKLNQTPVGTGTGHLFSSGRQILVPSLLCCTILICLLHKLAHRFGMIDHPAGRKQHAQPTPTVGGIAMFATMFLILHLENQLKGDIAVLMNGAAILAALGALDDKYGLPVSLRMIVQASMSLLLIFAAHGNVSHLGALFGSDINLGLWAVPISTVALVGGINAMNMIDGADGMAGQMAAITLLGLTAIFYQAGSTEFLPLTWTALGALAGFLLFNSRLFIKRAWVFMGNGGSMLLGLLLDWFLVQITRGGISAEPALVLWLFGLPLLDTLSVMLRRLCRKRSPFAADRTHIHFVLQQAGLSVGSAVMTASIIQLLLVGTGVAFYLVHAPAAWVFWSFIAVQAAYCYCLRRF